MHALKKFQVWMGLLCGITLTTLIALPAQALTPADTPLFLTVNVAPNLVMTMDDSGSMGWGYIPDSVGSKTKRESPRFSAASYNGMYYDPKLNYPVPTRSDGVVYSTTFTKAWVNGFDTSRGFTNLSSTGYQPIYNCYPEEGIDWSTCLKVPSLGAITSTKTEKFTYTKCQVFFDDRNKNNDRIYVYGCTPDMPPEDEGSPSEADNGNITITGASGYSGTYTVSSSQEDSDGDVQINLNSKNLITKDSKWISEVSISWNVTKNVTSSSAAYYHLFYKDMPGGVKPSKCDDNREADACYILIQVGTAADITAGSSDAQKQNFANWYSFYRSRALSAVSATMSAVTGLQDGQLRLGWQTLNGCKTFGTACADYNGVKRENRLRNLTADHRTNFYNWLERYDINGGTPLRSAMKRAGDYFSTSGKDSPYAENPYVSTGTELSCRKNFHIMVTDGFWNSDDSVDFGGNLDSTNKTLPDGTTYTPRYPYRNEPGSPSTGLSYGNSLADIAFKYWYTDLRTDLGNNVVPHITDRSGTAQDQYWNPKNNPATWQNMATYTIGMGLSSVLEDPEWGGSTYVGDYPDLASGTKFWPAIDETPPSSPPVGHVYDLWHAAINGRGQFFSADNPESTNAAFKTALSSILNANPSSAALAANSTSIQTGTMIYQARFDSQDWHGEFLAFAVQGNGTIGSQLWDAGKLMPLAASRKIFSHNGTNGIDFTSCANLSAEQKLALDTDGASVKDNRCTDRLAWLRGEASKEVRNGGNLRNRPVTVLGDIINSDPAFTYDEDLGYGGSTVTMTGASSYKAFVAAKKIRPPMVYVGGNDGMLHGFRADIGHANSGREIMAYIPAGVYGKLSKLTAPNYSHQYLVDGPPSVGDAYFGGSWKTVLVAGLGAGGKSVYALNVSSPDAFAASHVMWEFTDADLGYTYSQPQIARLNNGDWAAIFGNGYGSTSGKAFLYVVNIADGTLLKKIPAGTATGNGLSTPVLYDKDNDKIIDAVYAGDLKGNLWEFDMAGTTAGSWIAANSGSPLFAAKDSDGNAQPITSQPKVGPHSNGGVMVYFGTGSYIGTTDPSSSSVQSFYAIWDKGGGGFSQ